MPRVTMAVAVAVAGAELVRQRQCIKRSHAGRLTACYTENNNPISMKSKRLALVAAFALTLTAIPAQPAVAGPVATGKTKAVNAFESFLSSNCSAPLEIAFCYFLGATVINDLKTKFSPN